MFAVTVVHDVQLPNFHEVISASKGSGANPRSSVVVSSMLDALHEVLVPGVGEKTADALDIVAGMVSGTGRSLPNEHSGSLILQRAVAEEVPA